jgi:hypothetical protein
MGSFGSWSAYFAAGNKMISSISYFEIYAYLQVGYNFIKFAQPVDVLANTLVSWSTEPGRI